MSLLFKNLSCSLGGKKILKNLSGEIPAGKITAVLGANGCGKSTFLRALLGLVPLESGEIILQGQILQHLPHQSEKLGYMPQAREIHWPLTCEAVIELGIRDSELVRQIASRLKIQDLLTRRIDQVSGGEKTLILLARTLMNRPEIIIVDEPVAELDPAYQIRVMKILREETERGALVLTTMHDVSLTARHCDRILLMKEGSIFNQGEAELMLTESYLTEVFQVSFSAVNHQGGKIFYAEG